MNSVNPAASLIHADQRLVLLQHGGVIGKRGKTGLSLLRYFPGQVVAVIDPETAGQSLQEVTGISLQSRIPILPSVKEALQFEPTAMAIGIAPSGGQLPEECLQECRAAVRSGISILNGLHTSLASDPEIAPYLNQRVLVWDMRREPAGLRVGTAEARRLQCERILFVGTDMAIGKMSAAIELCRAALSRGLKSHFLATGQAGMMISGAGFCLDAVRVDFASGAVEAEVLKFGSQNDWLFIEGQGSLLNPASTATLPLLRGSQPTQLILVHKPTMKHLRDFDFVRIPPLRNVVRLYEEVAGASGAFPSCPVTGIALNTFGMTDGAARESIDQVASETNLPCTDTVRYGGGKLLDALIARAKAGTVR